MLASLTLVPSCGQSALAADCPASFRDGGVFALNASAVGESGTACAGVPFTVTTIDAQQGKVQFTPSTPVLLSIGRPGESPSCRVGFTFDTLRMPGFDTDPATAGIQTGRVAVATATHTDGSSAVTIKPEISGTIFPAGVTLTGSIDGGLVNTPLTDRVTLTGGATAPV